MVYGTSKRPRNDIGSFLGPCSREEGNDKGMAYRAYVGIMYLYSPLSTSKFRAKRLYIGVM